MLIIKQILTIFYQFNVWQPSIGNIQTIIKSFIDDADEFDVRLVGTGDTNADKLIHFIPMNE